MIYSAYKAGVLLNERIKEIPTGCMLRLLDNSKLGNSKKFMEEIMPLYVHYGRFVPKSFMKLGDDKVSNKEKGDIMTSFLVGLAIEEDPLSTVCIPNVTKR